MLFTAELDAWADRQEQLCPGMESRHHPDVEVARDVLGYPTDTEPAEDALLILEPCREAAHGAFKGVAEDEAEVVTIELLFDVRFRRPSNFVGVCCRLGGDRRCRHARFRIRLRHRVGSGRTCHGSKKPIPPADCVLSSGGSANVPQPLTTERRGRAASWRGLPPPRKTIFRFVTPVRRPAASVRPPRRGWRNRRRAPGSAYGRTVPSCGSRGTVWLPASRPR